MIDKTHQLSVRQQSQLIQINRSTLYYKPKEISSTDLSWMRQRWSHLFEQLKAYL
jgi:putative transposase